jgi:hypothetical protein
MFDQMVMHFPAPRRFRMALCAMLLASAHVVRAGEWRSLFDGTLEGWRPWLGTPEAGTDVPGISRGANGKYAAPLGWDHDPLKVVSVVNTDGESAIRLSGQIFGMLMSRESFANYHLRLQFKWGEKKWPPRESRPRDSGVLYHVHSEPGVSYGVWPASLELQLQEHDCGDLYTLITRIGVRAKMGSPVGTVPGPSFTYDPLGERYVFEEKPPVNNRCMRSADFERPNGEWNTIELVCFNGASIYIVNGKVVMRLDGAEKRGADDGWIALTQGRIALQTEGAEVFYRKIELRAIDAIPTEFEVK